MPTYQLGLESSLKSFYQNLSVQPGLAHLTSEISLVSVVLTFHQRNFTLQQKETTKESHKIQVTSDQRTISAPNTQGTSWEKMQKEYKENQEIFWDIIS